MGRLTVDADTLLLYHCDETSVPGTGYATLVESIASGGTARNLTETNGGASARSPNYTHIINAGGAVGRLARWFPGKATTAAAFLSRAGDTASATALTGSYTVRFWVKADALASEIIALTGPTESTADNCLFQLTVLGTGLLSIFWEFAGGTNVTVAQTTGTGLSVGTWTYVAITVDNSGATSTTKFYVGTSSSPQQTVTGSTKATGGTTATWFLGCSGTSPTTGFLGSLTGVCVDTVVRTGAEIAAFAALGTSVATTTDGSTFIAWHCQEQPDLLDATAYGYHLRKIGAGAIDIVDPLLGDGGKARHADGTVEYIGHLGYAALIAGVLADYTLELWTRLDTGYTANQSGWASLGDWLDELSANNAVSWVLQTDRKMKLIYERGSGTDVSYTTAAAYFNTLADGYVKRHNAITKYDSGGGNRTAEFYSNGALFTTVTTTTDMDGGASDYFRLWVGDSGTPHPMLGTFDEVRLSKKRRSSAEILASFTTNVPVNALVSPAIGSTAYTTSVVIDVTHADGATALSTVTITAAGEPVFSGAATGSTFGTGYSSSTNGSITNGRRFTIARTGGWPASSLTVSVNSTDVNGGSDADSYTWTITFGAAPVITRNSPAIGNIANTTAIDISVTDADTNLSTVSITANGSSVRTGTATGAYDAAFATLSTNTGITNGRQYTFRPNSGVWPTGSLTVNVTAVDTLGNTTTTSFTWTVLAPVANPPTVTLVGPTNGTTILRTDSVVIDVTDPDNDVTGFTAVFNSALAWLAGSTTPLSAFSVSSRAPLSGAGNYRYTLRLSAGWPDGALVFNGAVSDSAGSLVSAAFSWSVVSPAASAVAADAVVAQLARVRDIEIDPETNDIVLTPTGDLSIIGGGPSIAQAIRQVLRTFLGEWFLDEEAGVPWYDQILIKAPNLPAVRAVIRDVILAVPGVLEVTSLSVDMNRVSRALAVTFTATSDVGELIETIEVAR